MKTRRTQALASSFHSQVDELVPQPADDGLGKSGYFIDVDCSHHLPGLAKKKAGRKPTFSNNTKNVRAIYHNQ